MPPTLPAQLTVRTARAVILLFVGGFVLASLVCFLRSPVSVFSVLIAATGLFLAWLSYQFLDLLRTGPAAGGLFLGALLLRWVLVAVSPPSNYLTDIGGHREMGTLVARGINPWDPADHPAERQRLRLDDIGYAAYTSQSQAMWDYHTGSQLPLYTFLMGWIETVWPSPYFHRLVYAFLDSLLCLLLYAFVGRLWGKGAGQWAGPVFRSRWLSFFSIPVALGALSPLLLRSGTLIPSTKSLMTLLVMGAVYFAAQPGERRPAWRGGLLLGASIGYMALGVFALPLFFVSLYASALKNSRPVAPAWGLGAVAVALGAGLWLVPFLPDLVHVVKNRTDFGATNALHASMWRFLAERTSSWRGMQVGTVLLTAVLVLIGVARRRLDLYLLTGLAFLGFLGLVMVDGSMDRIYIGVLLFVVFLGVTHPQAARALALATFGGGVLMLAWAVGLWLHRRLTGAPYVPFEVLDSGLNFLFFWAVFFFVARLTLGPTGKRDHPHEAVSPDRLPS